MWLVIFDGMLDVILSVFLSLVLFLSRFQDGGFGIPLVLEEGMTLCPGGPRLRHDAAPLEANRLTRSSPRGSFNAYLRKLL